MIFTNYNYKCATEDLNRFPNIFNSLFQFLLLHYVPPFEHVENS